MRSFGEARPKRFAYVWMMQRRCGSSLEQKQIDVRARASCVAIQDGQSYRLARWVRVVGCFVVDRQEFG
jgi:hypothetical protein